MRGTVEKRNTLLWVGNIGYEEKIVQPFWSCRKVVK